MSFSDESPSSEWENDLMYGRKSILSEKRFSGSPSKISNHSFQSPNLQTRMRQLEKENGALKAKVENHKIAVQEFQQFAQSPKKSDFTQDNFEDLNASKDFANYHLKQIRKERESIASEMDGKSAALQVDNNILKQQLHMAQLRIIELEDTVNKLTKDSKIYQMEKEKKAAGVARAKKSHEKAIEAIPISKKEAQMFAKAQKELEEQNILIMNYEKQMKSLAKVLEIQMTGTEADWHNIIDHTFDCKYKAMKVQQLEIENERLNNDLKITLEELNNLQEKRESENKEEPNDGVKDALQKMLHHERQQNIENSSLIAKLRAKVFYARVIENAFHKTINQINELHSAIHHSHINNFKTLIFTVILARQFSLKKQPGITFDSSNTIFGKNSVSIDTKMRDLRAYFSKLTEDLILTRSDLQESEGKRKKLKARIDAYQQMKENSNETKLEKRCRKMKRQIDDMQREMDQMVTPALYENAMKSLDAETNKVIELQAKINDLEDLIRKYEIQADEDKKTVDNATIKLNTANMNMEKLSENIKNKDKENEALQKLLKVKTKEILALERVVNRQSSMQITKQNEFDMMVGTKSKQSLTNIIQFDPFTRAKVRIGVHSGLQSQINKAFISC